MGWNYLPIPKLHRWYYWSLGIDRSFHPILYNGRNYLSMLRFKLNRVSKRGPSGWNTYRDPLGCYFHVKHALCLNTQSYIWKWRAPQYFACINFNLSKLTLNTCESRNWIRLQSDDPGSSKHKCNKSWNPCILWQMADSPIMPFL